MEPKIYDTLADPLGSVRAVTDQAGAVVWKSEYEPFGKVVRALGNQAFRGIFTGKETDLGTSRFITEDPARDGVNWYAYCNNNPLAYTDPTGMVLKIVGSPEFIQTVTNNLQKMDPNISVSKNGIVTTTSEGHSAGESLVGGLSGNRNITVIKQGDSNTTIPANENNASNSKGTNSTVTINNLSTGEPYYTKDAAGNLIKTNTTPSEITLGHELIHALHNANGEKNEDHSSFEYSLQGILDGKQRSGTVVIPSLEVPLPREEAKTVGLGSYRSDAITENKLRDQLGYDERASY